jgi:hypothetical protein
MADQGRVRLVGVDLGSMVVVIGEILKCQAIGGKADR